MTTQHLDEEWRPPATFKVVSSAELEDLTQSLGVRHRIDGVQYIADDMFELRHPDLMHDPAARTTFVEAILRQGPEFGRWVHYPWSDSLVRFAEPDTHFDLRTYRNRNLVSKEEQGELRRRRIAVFGLSVGSNVVDKTVQAGIGNEYLLFDHDRLSPTNLNRIHATMAQVGLLKTTIAGRKIAELDPYVLQRHFAGGYDANTDSVLRWQRPDVIVEEVDNLDVKARIRSIAKELRIPVVTAGDVGDRSTIDIERHDDEDVMPFNGKLSVEEIDALSSAAMPQDQQLNVLIKMLGRENISQILLDSVLLKGKELAGTPQLGTTAAIGGALASVAIREMFLKRDVRSSSNIVDAVQIVTTPDLSITSH
jgi:ThiF family protein